MSTLPAPTNLVATVDAAMPAPTYVDNFDKGKLSADWQVSTWPQSNYGGAGSDIQFSAAMIDLSQGCLRLQLQQPTAGTSIGAELQLKTQLGYGTYEWVFRAASTSPTATGAGTNCSGGVSSPFILDYENGVSVTEIDCPEIEGRYNNKVGYAVYHDGKGLGQEIYYNVQNPEAAFHTYRTVWSPGRLDFYIDGVLQGSVTGAAVPTHKAGPIMNHYATNSNGWGGLATVGVNRFCYFRSFKFWAA